MKARIYVATAGETYDAGTSAFVTADKTLNIFLRNVADDSLMTAACVGIRRPNPFGFNGGNN